MDYQEGYAVRRTMIVPAALGLALLAGCDNSAEPSPPPSSEDALTTATAAPATPSDEVEVTTEAAPTTQAPAETEIETATAEPQGAPEMPEAATEQTKEGAEAFALHYLDVVNYTGMNPEVGLLEPLGADTCQSCDNHEESVVYGVDNGDYLLQDTFTLGPPETVFTGEGARVSVPATQEEQDFYRGGEPIDRSVEHAEGTLVVRVVWQDGWLVNEITVEP